MDSERLVLWVGFNLFVLAMLALDLGVLHRKAHTVSIREAALWSAVWIVLALAFNSGIFVLWGREPALEFLTGYIIEKSLSVDNLFVFLMIFHYFATPPEYQHRTLFWGILGALIMRAIFIAAGAALLEKFHWMIYVFGGFLVLTGVKMLLHGDRKVEPAKNPAVRLMRRLLPITSGYEGQRFFVRRDGKIWATPLLLVLVVIETTDLIFAVDSIPAIFAITRDPFIVYTSNVFAILGLRALYFLLAGVLEMFRYLKVGLALVLCFVGVKMVVVDLYQIPIAVSLAVVASILGGSVLASIVRPARQARAQREPLAVEARVSRARWGWPAGLVAGLVVAATLLTVKCVSIRSGPSSQAALTAIRLAELERAAESRDASPAAAAVRRDVDLMLKQAREHWREDRYQNALDSAHEAKRILREHGKAF
ncbi:MAG TPA: TerC family protein [Candidatus Acidoferrales bacterium]|nr:TerC family protein [Candidatus Acidoferrales bacterium]